MSEPHLTGCRFVFLTSATIALATFGSCLLEVEAQPTKPMHVRHNRTLKPRRPIIEPHETPSPQQSAQKTLSFAFPPPPDNIWAPGQRSAEGSSRGSCNAGKNSGSANKTNSLTALVPAYRSDDSEVVWGQTTLAHPTFRFYAPYFSAIPGEFVLQNEADKTIYKSTISLPEKPGIISVSLPDSTPPLKVGSRYHWYFNVYCQSQQPPAFVHGWIQRENLSPVLKSKLSTMMPKDRVAFFATFGVWYDALAASAELRRVNPRDSTWNALLGAIGLNDIALEPIKSVAQNSSIPKF